MNQICEIPQDPLCAVASLKWLTTYLEGYSLVQILTFEERDVQLEKELETADELPTLLHPNMVKVYSRKINAHYEALLSDEGRPTAADLLRTFIDRIVLKSAGGKLDILIKDDIAGILSFASAEKELSTTVFRGGQVPVVTEARNHRNLPIGIFALFSESAVQPFDAAA